MYIGLFFHKLPSGKLVKDIKDKHITCAFRPVSEMAEELAKFLGLEFRVKVIGYANNGENEGLLCEPVDSFPYYGAEKMHITLSCSEKGKPVNTAFLDFKEIDEPYIVTGVMGVHP